MGISLAKAICVAQSGCHHILWSTTLVVAWCNLVDIVFRDMTQKQKVFDQFICCDGGHSQTNSLQALWRFCNGRESRFSTINLIVSTLVPSRLLKVVVLSPIVVRGSLLYSARRHPWQGVCRHLLWREGRFGPPRRMQPPLTYSPYSPWTILTVLAITYMPSLAYTMYLPSAMYMTLAMYTPSLVCLHVLWPGESRCYVAHLACPHQW